MFESTKKTSKSDARLAMLFDAGSDSLVAYALNSVVREDIKDMAAYLGFKSSSYSVVPWNDVPSDYFIRHWVVHYADAKRKRFQPVDKARKFVYS